MGNSTKKTKEEYKRSHIKCRGYVEKYSYKSGKNKKRYFELNGITLSYSKSKDIQASHTALIDRNFKILYDDLEKKEICIECVTEKGEISLWRLIFSSKENTEKWLNKLKKVVRPEWEDPKSKYCTVCSKEFGIFRRQHHCRKCGKVICGSHSVIIKSLEELGYMSRVRICTNCVNRIGNIDGIQRAKSLVQKEKEKNSTLFPNSFLGFAANGSLLTNNR